MLKKVLLSLIALFIIIQFLPVDRENPSSDADLEIVFPEDLKVVVEKACYDCHSNNTKWPWYSYVAPISFVVASHVEDARDEVNFSEWKTYSEKRRKHKMKEMVEEVEENKMPIPGYLAFHEEAILTAKEKELLFSWVKENLNITQTDSIAN